MPDPICNSTPTTDTYSLEQGQDEFYFALPYQKMDIALWCLNNGKSEAELAEKIGCSPEQAKHVYHDIVSKRRTTDYLHKKAVLVEDVDLSI